MRIYKIMFNFGDDSSDGSELLTVSMLVMVMVVMILFYLLPVGKERWWIVDDGGDDVVDHVDDFVDDFVLLAAGRQGEVVDCQN